MSALGHYLERAGIPTVSVSLIREHSEQIRPPRALWVPFELGRPLGPPHAADFQRRVLGAALALLTRAQGPVLEDFPEEAPATTGAADEGAWVCPVSFPQPAADEPSLAEALRNEVQGLKPWYELGLERRGRTTVGLSHLDIDSIVELLLGFAAHGDETEIGSESWQLKYAIDDLLAYYQEAAGAQPGNRAPRSDELLRWFWTETAASQLFRVLHERTLGSDDKALQIVGKLLLMPRALETFEGAAD